MITEDEKLFISTLDDLSLQMYSSNEYEVLKCSALIRMLLLDGSNSLLHKVNQTYRHKVKFTIREVTKPSGDMLNDLKFWSILDGLEPYYSNTQSKTISLNLDPFTNTVIGIVDSHEYSIGEVIRFVANVMGGVHKGTSSDENDRAVSSLKDYYFSDIPVLLQQIRVISRIILAALREIKQIILKIEEFESTKGVSIYLLLSIYQLKDRNNFIFDFGLEERKNRFFAYVNSGGEVCFRLYDGLGNYYAVNAGKANEAFRYGHPLYLSFKIAVLQSKLLLSIDLGIWNYIKVYETVSDFMPEMHWVLGSDLVGKEYSNIAVIAQLIYSASQNLSDQRQSYEYCMDRLYQDSILSVRFEGNKFMYSANHPRFQPSTS